MLYIVTYYIKKTGLKVALKTPLKKKLPLRRNKYASVQMFMLQYILLYCSRCNWFACMHVCMC